MIVKCADFQPEKYFKDVPLLKNRKGNPAGKKRHYMAITTAFDIETTVLDDIRQSIMYIWQWQFSTDVTVIGRTWDEFLDLQHRIKDVLPEDRWLVVYVHNLSYEFQFLKGVYAFQDTDVFAVGSRKLLKCDMWGKFEFRCSYKLTNMSLGEFTKKFNVEHKKLSGDEYDYSIKRYPWTELTDEELEYCINDVLGLVEAVNALMARDGDTLQTIPMTSTGYVRRNAKRAMRNGIHHSFVYSILPDYDQYKALREAFRGGNTHANRYYAGDIVDDVHSADRSSSYPAVMCNCEFPMSVFTSILPKDLNRDYITRCITIRHKALLLRVRLDNVVLKDRYWGCPYLSKDKCRNIKRPYYTVDGLKDMVNQDNGRILSADSLETTITDVDLRIIGQEYDCQITFLQGWYSSYKKLPQPLIDEVIKYYKEKTELKGVEGQEIYYDKAKALLNALYGMLAQDPCKARLIFAQEGDWEDEITKLFDFEDDGHGHKKLTETAKELIKSKEMEILGKHNEKAFLCYQWGVWVTAWSRLMLEEGIRIVHDTKGADFIYCDTDSVKYIGNVDWTDYNNARIAECLESGSYATDPKGITHYMGVFENEDRKDTGIAYKHFKTLGAKKYAYVETEGGKTHCTIAGVNKKKGGAELDEHDGLNSFEDGFVFRKAGGTMAVYNDNPEISEIQIDGHLLTITSNVAILPSEYKLGITGEYERILKFARGYIDNPFVI